jgi:O-antigen/teichoic acid export membrane protein
LTVRAIDSAHLTLIGSYSGFAFVGALASSIAFQTDALVITAFLGAALVTPFALASGLVDNARSLVYSATWVLSPTASELDTLGERDKLQQLLIAGCKYSVLVCWPVLLGLIVFGENLIVTWVGPKYATSASFASVLSAHGPQASAAQILVLLSLPTLISLPQSTASSLLYGVSRHRGVVGLSLLNAALNLALSLWWAKTWGLAGVALGTAVPLALVGGIATQFYVCRALGLAAARYTWEGVVQPGLVCLAFLVPALIVQRIWNPIGWLPLAAASGGCWAIFALAAWRFSVTLPERARWGRMLPGLLNAREVTAGGTHR